MMTMQVDEQPDVATGSGHVNDASGLVIASAYPVAVTLNRLEAIWRAKGATIFARIDHAAAAAAVGLTMRPAQVLRFGNPRLGTPVMLAAATLAIDLPFKPLAWEDAGGKVWLAHNTASYLAHGHWVVGTVAAPLAAIAEPIEAAVRAEW